MAREKNTFPLPYPVLLFVLKRKKQTRFGIYYFTRFSAPRSAISLFWPCNDISCISYCKGKKKETHDCFSTTKPFIMNLKRGIFPLEIHTKDVQVQPFCPHLYYRGKTRIDLCLYPFSVICASVLQVRRPVQYPSSVCAVITVCF